MHLHFYPYIIQALDLGFISNLKTLKNIYNFLFLSWSFVGSLGEQYEVSTKIKRPAQVICETNIL